MEVGCGSGHVLQRFLEFGVQQAIGIDLIEDRLRKAVAKYPNIQVMLGDGAEIPCNDAEFDLVMQFMCLSSVLDDAIRFQIAKEMWRVLKPGGAVLSYDLRSIPRVTVISLKVLNRFSLLLRGMRFSVVADSHNTPTKPLDAEEINNMFNKGQIKLSTTSLNFDLARIAKKSYLLATLLSTMPGLRTHYFAIIKKPAKLIR